VVLIGDEYGGVIMRDIAARERSEIRRLGDTYELKAESVGLTLRSLAPGGSVTALANLLHASNIALIVVDATVGPTPTIREHVLVARQARTPMLAMLLGNVKGLYAGAPEEAAELLALEIREIRELLSTYDLDGNSALVFYDAQTPGPGGGISAFGARETLHALSRFTPRRVHAGEIGSASEIWGAVYLLTEPEADGHAVSLKPDDSIIVWSEGTQSRAKLTSLTPYHPGDFREMPLSMEAPLKGREGSRILLVNGDRIVGLGAITQIGR
jgi:translation elongation factor EF-Tu-like GTPase